jgi:hypothetical protein
MPFELKWEQNNSIFSFRDNVDGDELLKASDILIGDPRFDAMNYTIFDLLNIKKLNVVQEDIIIISTIDKGSSRWNKYLKVACIATDNYTKSIVLEYKKMMLETNWEIELFSNLDEAELWCKEK